jgi:UDP-N-acetylmuramate dehydrogenase
VGSAPVQNIGAYGTELKDHLEWLEAWDLQEGRLARLLNRDCQFGYRNSMFKGKSKGRFIITKVVFRLSKTPRLNLGYGNIGSAFHEAGGITAMDLRNVVISVRKNKLPDPAEFGNAGSFFKNPVIDRTLFKCIRVEYPDIPNYSEPGNLVKLPAAYLIEKAGWKGKRIGNVGTWPAQPLVIVNYGNATGREILEFSLKIEEEVKHLFGISLEKEVRVI